MDFSPSSSAGPVAEPSPAAQAPPAPAAGEDFGPLVLPAGLPGFPDARAFRLRRLAGAGEFALLEAEEPDGPRFVVLPVAEPEAVFGPAGTAEAAAALGVDPANLLLLVIVTLAAGPAGRAAFVNLRAPVAVDVAGRTARQLVLADPGLPLRQPLEPRVAA